jgi:hypothetical protein
LDEGYGTEYICFSSKGGDEFIITNLFPPFGEKRSILSHVNLAIVAQFVKRSRIHNTSFSSQLNGYKTPLSRSQTRPRLDAGVIYRRSSHGSRECHQKHQVIFLTLENLVACTIKVLHASVCSVAYNHNLQT